MLWLEVNDVIDDSNPLGAEGGEGYDQRPGTASIGADQCPGSEDGVCQLGWVAADIQVSANNDWLEANPAAAKLLELFKMSVIDVSLMNVEMAEGTAVLDLAQGWIDDNRAQVDEWLEAARAAVLAVRVRSPMAVLATVALLAAEGAANTHPETRLPDVARVATVAARARLPPDRPKLFLP